MGLLQLDDRRVPLDHVPLDHVLLNDVFGHDDSLLARKVFRVGDVIGRHVHKDHDAHGVKGKDDAAFLDVGYGDRVEAETDGFARGEETAVDTLAVTSVDMQLPLQDQTVQRLTA